MAETTKKNQDTTTFDKPKRGPSKKARPDGLNKKGLPDGRIKNGKYLNLDLDYIGQDPAVTVMPAAIDDPEDILNGSDLDDYEEEDFLTQEDLDAYPKGKHPYILYPPPRPSLEFRTYWKAYIEELATKPGFKKIFLYQLEIICALHVENDQLSKFIRTRGHTYETTGRQGRQVKTYPEVGQRNLILREIASYSKALGLTIGGGVTRKSIGGTGNEKDWE